jgi:hypothetical protein
MSNSLNPTQVITPTHLQKALTYAQYRQLLDSLLADNLTTGPNQSPMLVEYARLNVHRMQRLDKTVLLTHEVRTAIESLSKKLIWVVLTEGWCGDAAQSLPVLAQVAALSQGKIELKLLLRDENLEVMDAYLTHGSRSIPKLICLDAQHLVELGTWGPRPAVVQAMVLEHMANPQGQSHEQFIETVHAWYAKDKTAHLQQEITALLQAWEKVDLSV